MENKLKQIALSDALEWDELEDNSGLKLKHTKYNTVIQATWTAIEKYTLDQLVNLTSCGHNVTGITRVTGYMSTTDNWNKGKIAELKDRVRSDI